MDFGAFVEIEPGVEGLIHISEMSWGKKIRHPSDLLKQGDRVDAVILSVKPEERRIALGLKQTLADPWLDAQRNFPVGSQVEGPVTKLMNFGAFVQIADGVEGLVHISEIVADRRLNHPADVLRAGQVVKAQVLAIDAEKRQIKLSMKQLIPTEHRRVHRRAQSRRRSLRPRRRAVGNLTVVELGEGIRATCRAAQPPAVAEAATPAAATAGAKPDLSASRPCSKPAGKATRPPPQPNPSLWQKARSAASKSRSSMRKQRRSKWSWPRPARY